MPVSITKKDGGYQVRTPTMVHSKKTTLEKAMAQKRLLNAVEHGWTPGRRQSNPRASMIPKGVKPMRMSGP